MLDTKRPIDWSQHHKMVCPTCLRLVPNRPGTAFCLKCEPEKDEEAK